MQPLQRMVEEGLGRGLYLGAAYRVFRLPDEILAAGVAGDAQADPRVPVTEETVWDLASLTKPVATATALLILAGEGALHLDEPVDAFLPGPSPSLAGITLRHCLTHTSGLKAWEQFHSHGHSREEILRRVRASERQRRPGTGYTYSDLGYILLGEVVEAVAGQPLDDFARERIFEPLGMRSTRYRPPAEWRPRLAATRCPDRARVLLGEVHDGNCDALGGVASHAGLFGTMGDLERYARMLLRGGELDGVRILPPLLARAMGRNANPPGLNGHTLGWFTRPNGYLPAGDFLPDDTFGHTGFTGTSLLLSPSLGLGAILLTNRVYHDRDAAPFLQFRRRFHNAVAALVE
ncbi:MAG TPA: serine hydrolase domain-containing protein [Armatimonadota bacterium]|nr:serine hydrolase domain-containing protein [Armatimonadota bacterium]